MAPKRKKDANVRCECEKINCMKRYCVCFAVEKYCNEDCSCKECFNRLGNEKKIDKACEEAKFRNPYAFSTKVQKEGERKIGCKCRVTKCSSDKCKCYKANVECGDQCLCVICKNGGKRGDNIGMVIEETDKRDSEMEEIEFVIGTSSRDSDRKRKKT